MSDEPFFGSGVPDDQKWRAAPDHIRSLLKHVCVHCGQSPAPIDVPIDDEVARELPDGRVVEIRAWSCVDCVHKRATWR